MAIVIAEGDSKLLTARWRWLLSQLPLSSDLIGKTLKWANQTHVLSKISAKKPWVKRLVQIIVEIIWEP